MNRKVKNLALNDKPEPSKTDQFKDFRSDFIALFGRSALLVKNLRSLGPTSLHSILVLQDDEKKVKINS